MKSLYKRDPIDVSAVVMLVLVFQLAHGFTVTKEGEIKSEGVFKPNDLFLEEPNEEPNGGEITSLKGDRVVDSVDISPSENFISDEEDIVPVTSLPRDHVLLNDVILQDGLDPKMVEDLTVFDEVNSKKHSGEDIIEQFEPIHIPTDFSSYDSNPKDGYITLKELIDGTGAEENARGALIDADVDGDGRLSQTEFLAVPWNQDLDDEE